MINEIDLQALAIERGGTNRQQRRTIQQLLTRYVLPIVLIVGFLSLVVWASRNLIFPPQPVTVLPVYSSRSEIRQEGTPLFKAAGWIEPRPTPVRVAALAPGVVEALLVVEDQQVRKGQPIARLVQDDASLALARSKTDLELRQAEQEQANATFTAAKTRFNQPVHLEAALSEAEASLAKLETELRNLPFQIRRAEADYEAHKKDYEGKAFAQGVVAGVTIDIARSKATADKATVEELQNRLGSLTKEQDARVQRRNALRTQLQLLANETQSKDEAEAKVKAALARVAQQRVVVAEAQLRLDRMTVVSPIDGRVFRLIAHPGARIGDGMTQMEGHDGSTIVTLYRPEMLQIRVDVRFEDIPQVSLNQPVEIDNPALPDPLLGRVLFISSEADIQKNTLQVKVAIPKPPSVFKPEMLVDVTFLAPKQAQRAVKENSTLKLYTIQQLIHTENGNAYIWLADQSDGVARKTQVQTGETGNNGLVEIKGNLTVASRIIVGGADRLQDGERIRVTGEDASLKTKNVGLSND